MLASLLLGVAGTVLLAAPAAAHASLVRVSPANGSTLSDPVARVTLTFDENVRSPLEIVVTGPHGQRASHGATTVVDNEASVAITLRPRPEDVGRYLVGYRAVSADGHPVSGESSFQYRPVGVTAATGSAGATASSGSSRAWWIVGGVALALLLAGFLVLPLVRRGGPSGNRR